LTISEAVAEKVLELISAGKLVWGQRLPSQRELAGMLKVSVSSLREGLQILQATGYIEVKRGQGTYISASPEGSLTRNISRLINIDANVKNLMEQGKYWKWALPSWPPKTRIRVICMPCGRVL